VGPEVVVEMTNGRLEQIFCGKLDNRRKRGIYNKIIRE
jgi:hypothetical protein